MTHILLQPNDANNPNFRRMTNPSIMGYATAEGLAKFWSIVANGGQQGGKQVISKSVLTKMGEQITEGIDFFAKTEFNFGRGVAPLPAPDGVSHLFDTLIQIVCG